MHVGHITPRRQPSTRKFLQLCPTRGAGFSPACSCSRSSPLPKRFAQLSAASARATPLPRRFAQLSAASARAALRCQEGSRSSPLPVAPQLRHGSFARHLRQLGTSAKRIERPESGPLPVACLLWRVKCDEGLILHLLAQRGIESIADFAIFDTLDSHEAKIAEEVSRAGLMDNPLQVSRLRSAWQLARAELSKAMESLSNAQSPTSSSDLDDPLDEEAEAKRAKGFGEAYDGFLFESDSVTLARTISRVYRELSAPKRQILTIPLKKMRAEGDVVGCFEVRKKADPKGLPSLPDLKLGQGGLMLLLNAARVLCNAWAFGADLVEHPTEKSGDGSPQKGPEHSFVASPALA